MRHSPARAHMQHHVAAARASADDGTIADRALATGYELMLAQLGEHKRRLRDIKSNEAKAEAKAKLLPEYDAYIAAALATDAGGQDDVLSTLMVWHIDAGNYAQAIKIGAYVIRHGLAMPDQYKRDPAGALVEETADAALKAKAAGEPFDVSLLVTLVVMTEPCDMHDEIRAKLHKAIGLTLATDDADQIDLEAAVKHLTRALELHDKSGVKRDIELIQRRIKALGKEQAGATDGAG
ncbi:phage terminase small subunit [Denitromonas iodatirespirans]|uniref:Terminase n=1 Tax=Denitromonas iodatirespirans TaxID=2795389 RepID=A0A944DN26_DENI1|nr:phage terminase small subunit [Denitromonas iodatirespirans]MBT0961654.1 hypothetical protein [Denitromonas iodatirespirans]